MLINHQLSKKIKEFPFSFLLLVAFVCLYNFLILYSAAGESLYPWCYRQIIFVIIFFPIMILIGFVDLKFIFYNSYYFYVIALLFLLFVEFFGYSAMGAKRWINLGFTKIQPSELIKISTILALSRYFHSLDYKEITKFKNLLPAIFYVIVPFILIARQPDLGTALILLFVGAIIFFASGVMIWKFLLLLSSVLCFLPILWNYLYDYQKKRVMIFLNPELDPLGAGYNIIQSKIAIGSGGFWGKGFGQGTQTKLDFLPEHQTDFIFATLVEEFGFIGGIILVILYSLIIITSLSIAFNSRSLYGRFVALGIASMFFCHVFINIAMVMGLLPAVGIPLPLMSYGGTITATTLMSFGLLINVYLNQKINIAK